MTEMGLNESILKIAQGVYRFQSGAYKEKQQLFKTLAKSQHPKVLFITCSDSRVSPSLITQTEPGEMFLVQNVGNIVPPRGIPGGGVGASIEYAVSVLNVEHVVVCGHSGCGAMAALFHLAEMEHLPAVRDWLQFAEFSHNHVQDKTNGMSDDERLDYTTKTNIQVQLEHLRHWPSVASKLADGQIALHGWQYHIESGQVEVYRPETDRFASLEDVYAVNLSETD